MHASTGISTANLGLSTAANSMNETSQLNNKYRKISLKGIPLLTSLSFKLNINHVDKLALQTYRQLILDKEANQKPYLLALVVGKYKQNDPHALFPYHFHDAIKLNNFLLEDKEILCAINAIFYFSLEPQSRKFTCLTSETAKDGGMLLRNQEALFMIAKSDEETAQGKFNLAECYAEGIGTSVDTVKAFELYQASANLNFTEAQLKIAENYVKGIGVARDQKMAFKYYQDLALKENATAQYALGVMYLKGKIVEKNSKEAAHQFKRAISNGCERSPPKLAALYLAGEGVPKNPEKAIDFYLLASTNNAASLFALGQIYAEGTDIKKNVEKAKYYYTEAKKLGHHRAAAALEELPGFSFFE